MTPDNTLRVPSAASRRDFMKTSAAAAAGGSLFAGLSLARSAHAQGSDVLRVGLIGCGGRGTGAASQALAADPQAKLTVMGDAFSDRLESSLNNLRKIAPEQVDVAPDQRFVGFDAYRQVLAAGVDVVLLTTPPHFRPAHFKAAVEAGVHVFCEKPVAVDAPGIRSVLATGDVAKKKGLSVVSGLCYRYDEAKQATVGRVHDGSIGRIVAMHVSYNTGTLWSKPRQPEWTDMEWQLRNWLYFTWLSGDHNVEQHVHSLDKAAWCMRDETPVKAVGLGGRQVRTDPAYGNIYDHHAVVYEYASGIRLFSNCRQQAGCATDVSDYVFGTKGVASLMRHTISGENAWQLPRGKRLDMYQAEHNALFASIRSGNPINNTRYMAQSSMMAILGRMATYTGQEITWDEAMASTQDLSPKSYDWGPIDVPSVAMPGITQFV